MAAPSRPYDTQPVLVRRDDTGMAAEPIMVEAQHERIWDMNSGSGAERLQESDTNMNDTLEQPSLIPSSQPLEPVAGAQNALPSQSEQRSTPAIPTPTNNQGMTLQSLSVPSLSMDASSTLLLESVASFVGPTLTIQVEVNTMDATTTIQAAFTTVPAFLADSGAKMENEALPGMNQGDPSLVKVPGMNQGDPQLVTAPGETALAAPEGAIPPSSTSAMLVDRPMPGKNQPNPTTGAVASSLTMLSNSSPTVTPTLSSITSSTTSTNTAAAAVSSEISFSMLPTLVTSSLSSTVSSTPTRSSVISPVLTFVTITRTVEGKEDAQPSTQTVPAPKAVTAAQSPSLLFLTSSLAASPAIPSSLATAVSVESQSGLTPLTRSLFILFGVLGFITIIVALSIVWVMRSNKRRAQASRQQAAQDLAQDTGEYDGYGNITRVSANSSIKTFLTASETAIVNRAATPDGDTDGIPKPSNALTEAINSFITKSRRLTYKISP